MSDSRYNPSASELEEITRANIGDKIYEKLQASTVAVAGLGGLGSVVAMSLLRAGLGNLIIVDFDKVEISNLNRQQYFADQIGMYKTDAMLENLRRINPYAKITAHTIKLDARSVEELFSDVDVVAECFDVATAKQMIVETVLSRMPNVGIVAASGVAGFGRSNVIETKKISSRFVLVGDLESEIGEGVGLYAARVGIGANHQANAIIEMLIEKKN